MINLEQAKQRVKDRCNLIGENVDVYKIMFQYKAIRGLKINEIDNIYDEIVESLGF